MVLLEGVPDSVEEERANQPEGYWTGYCHALAYRKKTDLYPRDAVLVSPRVGTLHIRIGHARRPDRVQLIEGLKPNNRKLVLGWGRPLDYTLRRYRPDDKTVAWDVFFRLPPRPTGSHYYLNIWADWEHVPGRHVSSGDSGRFFHVKTR